MIQRVLSHYHLPGLACGGLVIFMFIFCAALAWVFRRGSSQFYAGLEQFPFHNSTEKSKGKSNE